MRTIKFRAWDGFCMAYFNILGNNPSDKNLSWISDQTLMQFTGLLDKNSREIYFGDILATSNKDNKYDIWSKEDYGFSVVVEDKFELGVSFSRWHISALGDSVYNNQFVEVIGNIWENPELLNPPA